VRIWPLDVLEMLVWERKVLRVILCARVMEDLVIPQYFPQLITAQLFLILVLVKLDVDLWGFLINLVMYLRQRIQIINGV